MTSSSWLPLGVLTQSLPCSILVAFVQQQRGVSAVVHDQLRALAAGMGQRGQRELPVFLERLALERKNWDARLWQWRPRPGPEC